MTYIDKELDNVLDIFHFKIKVGHPNGTKAYIYKIENLRLSNGLTLYDVMVIPEYCVTLSSVHKLVKENKVIVAFDENRCYFLNQDLNLKNVIEIGEQCKGLYYYNDQGSKHILGMICKYMCFSPLNVQLSILNSATKVSRSSDVGCPSISDLDRLNLNPFQHTYTKSPS
ncbi:hypothetical protein Tco_1099658 [Tanacetum coccineum]